MARLAKIVEFLEAHPDGRTARQIASSLGYDKAELNRLLHGSSEFRKLEDGRAWVIATAVQRTPGAPARSTASQQGFFDEQRPAAIDPQCPECGGAMAQRVARQGRRRGQRFWGCRRYPGCEGLINIAGSDAAPAAQTEADKAVPSDHVPDDGHDMLNRPRHWQCAPLTQAHRAVTIEAIGIPRVLAPSVLDGIALGWRRALAQWRLELPVELAGGAAPLPAWVHVARGLLRRGRHIPLAPELEAWVCMAAGLTQEPSALALKRAVESGAHGRTAVPVGRDAYDSDEERSFAERVLPEAWRPWTQSQVRMDSLTAHAQDAGTDTRVDFFIAHPSGIHLVVEIDGEQHSEAHHAQADQRRDARLREAGLAVHRVPAAEVRAGKGPALASLLERLASSAGGADEAPTATARWIHLCRRAHQIQLAVLEWLGAERPTTQGSVSVEIRLDPATRQMLPEPEAFVAEVLRDLSGLVADICAARGEDDDALKFVAHRTGRGTPAQVHIDFQPPPAALDSRVAYIVDVYIPFELSAALPSGQAGLPCGVAKGGCQRMLTRIFGFSTFREGQFEALERAMLGRDAIVLLPTGSGKSIAYQLPALLRGGVCLVVDPILSLIEDQMQNLRRSGVDRVVKVTSDSTPQEQKALIDEMARGEYMFCFIAPERMQRAAFREGLRVMTEHMPVSLVAIDEAHCVSEWGHDFRPAYLNIARNTRSICASAGVAPPIMALTGTASHAVLRDVQRALDIEGLDAVITPTTFDRPELSFKVIKCPVSHKPDKLKGALLSIAHGGGLGLHDYFRPNGRLTNSGCIFFPHTKGTFGVIDGARLCGDLLREPVVQYFGLAPPGIPNDQWVEMRRDNARKWRENLAAVMACTSSFGMGIDKPNVRWTIHYGLPGSIESFYQEAGRAGRDRKRAECIVLLSPGDEAEARKLLSPTTSPEEVRQRVDDIGFNDRSDISNRLWFHGQSFPGVAEESAWVKMVLERLAPIGSAHEARVILGKDKDKAGERALHRLILLGVVADYMVEGQSAYVTEVAKCTQQDVLDSFTRYIQGHDRQRAVMARRRVEASLSRPLAEFVWICALEVVQFAYEVVERARRRNLDEMLRLAEDAASGGDMRQGILFYLERSQFSDRIEQLRDQEDGGLGSVAAIIDDVRSAVDAARVCAEAGRLLGDLPTHPGLLLLRAAGEALGRSPRTTAIIENAQEAARAAGVEYGVSLPVFCEAAVKVMLVVSMHSPGHAEALLQGVLAGAEDRQDVAREMLRLETGPLEPALLAEWLSGLARTVRDFNTRRART